MGVAPPPAFGRYDSTPPTINGGNMDNKELVEGTTLYLPVWTPGALFEIGDGHAGQGNGEVDVTAMETSLVGELEFIVRKDLKIDNPRAETPTHYISMGFDDDLSIAAHKAVREMVDFLVTEKHMSRDDAYMLTSVAGDVDITELVDRNKGVHVMLPKAIFAKRAGKVGKRRTFRSMPESNAHRVREASISRREWRAPWWRDRASSGRRASHARA
jgi:acetamidase/formamidase